MLRHQDRDTDLGRQSGEESAESMDSAGRGTDRQQLERLAALRAKLDPWRCRRGSGDRATIGIAKLAQLAEQHFGKASVEAPSAGLGQRVMRAQCQRSDG